MSAATDAADGPLSSVFEFAAVHFVAGVALHLAFASAGLVDPVTATSNVLEHALTT